MNNDSLQLYNYHVWANERVFDRLLEVPREVCDQEIQSVFPTITKALIHMLQMDHVWLHAMKGDSYDDIRGTVARISQEMERKGLEHLRTLFCEVSERYKDFFHQLPDLDAVTDYPHPQYGVLKASYNEIVQHIVNHGTYHRGNISAMLRQLGHAGASTDYVFYLYEVKR